MSLIKGVGNVIYPSSKLFQKKLRTGGYEIPPRCTNLRKPKANKNQQQQQIIKFTKKQKPNKHHEKVNEFRSSRYRSYEQFFATNNMLKHKLSGVPTPTLTPQQVVNYVVQNYNNVSFTIATNETADAKIIPVSTWATGSMTKTNAACKSLKSAPVN